MGLLSGPRNAAQWFALRQRWVAALLILAGAAACFLPVLLAEPGKRLLWRAADALIREQYREAERLARAVLEQRPGCASAMLIAGEAMVKLIHKYVYSSRPYEKAAKSIRNGSMRINQGAALNVTSVEDQLNWFKAEGLVDKAITLETLLDTSYVKAL